MDGDDGCLSKVVTATLATIKERVRAELQAQGRGDKEQNECPLNANPPQSPSASVWVLPKGVKAEIAGSWVSGTLSVLLKEVGKETPRDALQNKSEQLVVAASALLDHTWQQLNTGACCLRSNSY